MVEQLELALLGYPQVFHRGGLPLSFPRKKSLALLSYLAITRRPHSRDELAALLWGESTDANARADLRRTLSCLHRWVGAHVSITRQAVSFDRTQPYQLDVEAFEGHIAQSSGNGLRSLTPEGAEALSHATELYQGDFMQGFHVHGALAFEEWLALERERLRMSALDALHRLADYQIAQGANAKALACATRILALDPADEKAHRRVISLLAACGERAAALRQYEVCRRAVADLGVEPDEETTALYTRIRGWRPCPPSPNLHQRGLPSPLTPLIGREQELTRIAQMLLDPECRLLTILGPGGIGKTHLARVAAAAQIGQFEHGLRWVSLSSVDAAEAFVPAIARSLDLSFSGDACDRRQQLLDRLRDKDMLLVLDGFEHLREGADLVHDMLDAAPRVKVLITSQFALDLRAEYILPVAGLRCPDQAASLDGDLDASSGVSLFVQGTSRVDSRFRLRSGDREHIVRICRLVDGIPLAILLAASWSEVLTPAEIEARLAQEGLDFLRARWTDVPECHCSIRQLYDRTWELLSDRERGLLAGLSVFRGGFTAQAALGIVGLSLSELSALMAKSLLQPISPKRFAMHDLLRQYAAEKLARSPDAGESCKEWHSACFLEALRDWGRELEGQQKEQILEEMGAEQANVQAAWEWAAARALTSRPSRLSRYAKQLAWGMDALGYFLARRGRFREGERAMAMAVQSLSPRNPASDHGLLSPPISPDQARALLMALAWQAVMSHRAGQLAQADQLLQKALAILDDQEVARVFQSRFWARAQDLQSELAWH